MNVFAIGDVHGCYHTLIDLVENHWNPKKEFLVQVGDLINKGPHSAQCVIYMRQLQKKYPYQVFVLRGNHEYRYIKLHDKPGRAGSIQKVKNNFLKHDLNLKKVHNWLRNLPFKWETPHILITHAGISKNVKNPYTNTNPLGVLHNRSEVRNMGKVQVYGHIIKEKGKVDYNADANSWCIDSGAWAGKYLSALRLSYTGDLKEIIQVQTWPEDL